MITFATRKSSPLKETQAQFIAFDAVVNTTCSDFYRLENLFEDVGILAHSKFGETVTSCFDTYNQSNHGIKTCKPILA